MSPSGEKIALGLLLTFAAVTAVALAVYATGVRPEGKTSAESAEIRVPRPPRSAGPLRVGVLYWSDTILAQQAMRAGLESEAARLRAASGEKLELLIRSAGDGPEGQARQIVQMRELIAARVDAIIVQPTDGAALSAAANEAEAAGIPVVAFDQYIEGGRLAAYLTSDNRQAGVLDAEYVANLFPDDRKIRLALVEYPQVSSTVERLDGFLATLADLGQPYEIVGTYQAVEPVSGKQAGTEILRDFPRRGSLDVIFSVNDGGGLAVVETLAAAGRDEIVVATIDGDPRSVEYVRAGKLVAVDSAQFCGPLGAAAMRAAWGLLHGEQVPRHQLIPTFPITRETLGLYPGWAGPVPEAFEKPWPSRQPRWVGSPHEVAAR